STQVSRNAAAAVPASSPPTSTSSSAAPTSTAEGSSRAPISSSTGWPPSSRELPRSPRSRLPSQDRNCRCGGSFSPHAAAISSAVCCRTVLCTVAYDCTGSRGDTRARKKVNAATARSTTGSASSRRPIIAQVEDGDRPPRVRLSMLPASPGHVPLVQVPQQASREAVQVTLADLRRHALDLVGDDEDVLGAYQEDPPAAGRDQPLHLLVRGHALLAVEGGAARLQRGVELLVVEHRRVVERFLVIDPGGVEHVEEVQVGVEDGAGAVEGGVTLGEPFAHGGVAGRGELHLDPQVAQL